jgi:hypothetical protein
MPTDPATVQEAIQAIREAYEDECHLAADAIVAKVRGGQIDTDDDLWDAITDTHQTRVDGDSVTPRWTPILLSSYRFNGLVSAAKAVGSFPQHESDVLWEYNRLAWIYDVCHVLREHHGMTIEGMTRAQFVAGNPIDSLTGRGETVDSVITELQRVAAATRDTTARTDLERQIRRLQRANTHLNPNPSPSAHR